MDPTIVNINDSMVVPIGMNSTSSIGLSKQVVLQIILQLTRADGGEIILIDSVGSTTDFGIQVDIQVLMQ